MRKSNWGAFSLVELMAVVGVMAILAVVAAPALRGLAGSGGRKQALGQLLGALELARNTAISTGTNAGVVFPDADFPNTNGYPYRSLAVIKWDPASSTAPNTMVTGWIALPQGVALHPDSFKNFSTLDNTTTVIIPPEVTPTPVPGLKGIVFRSDGGLFPENSRATSGVAFFEGLITNRALVRSGLQTNFEVIRISRYTGRARATLVSSNQVAP